MTDITAFRATPIAPANTESTSQLIARSGPRGVDSAGDAVGFGVAGAPGEAPLPLPGLALGAMMGALSEIMPKMSGEQLDVLVTSFTEKMKAASDASNKDQIKTEQSAKRAAIEAKKAKIDEAIKKQAEAEDKMKHAGVLDKIKLAFQWLGAVLAIAGGVIAMALAGWTGIGALGGALLIASGVCMLAMAVDATVQQAQQDQGKGDLGLFGMMCKSIALSEGKSEEDAEQVGQKGAMGFSIAVGALAAIFGIAGAGAGIASTAASMTTLGETAANDLQTLINTSLTGAETGAGTAEEAGTTASTVAQTTQNVAKITKDVVGVVTDVQGAAGSGVDVASAVEHYEASTTQADSLHDKASAKRMEAVQKALDDLIDVAISTLKSSGDRFNQILDGITDAMQDRAASVSHAQFRA